MQNAFCCLNSGPLFKPARRVAVSSLRLEPLATARLGPVRRMTLWGGWVCVRAGGWTDVGASPALVLLVRHAWGEQSRETTLG